ncbi:MAG: hypothetical protein ACI9TY_000944 [Alphaproteobacteria bacterium]|jgi:hypothetical protein
MLKTHVSHTFVSQMNINQMYVLRACFNNTTNNVDHADFFDETIENVSTVMNIEKPDAERRLKPYVFARIEDDAKAVDRHLSERLEKSMIQYAKGDASSSGR